MSWVDKKIIQQKKDEIRSEKNSEKFEKRIQKKNQLIFSNIVKYEKVITDLVSSANKTLKKINKEIKVHFDKNDNIYIFFSRDKDDSRYSLSGDQAKYGNRFKIQWSSNGVELRYKGSYRGNSLFKDGIGDTFDRAYLDHIKLYKLTPDNLVTMMGIMTCDIPISRSNEASPYFFLHTHFPNLISPIRYIVESYYKYTFSFWVIVVISIIAAVFVLG